MIGKTVFYVILAPSTKGSYYEIKQGVVESLAIRVDDDGIWVAKIGDDYADFDSIFDAEDDAVDYVESLVCE